jgi:hypothetical protein
MDDAGSPTVWRRRVERFAAEAGRLPVWTIAVIVGAAIGALVTFGVLQRTLYPHWGAANLDAEAGVGTWVSTVLLWAAALVWFLVASSVARHHPASTVWWLVLVWLALDERNALHERIERWSGLDWQVLYLPILGIAAAAWWAVVRRHRGVTGAVAGLVTAGAAWAAALTLELLQNWGGEPVAASFYDPAMILEEGLEMVGSTALIMAGLVVLGRSTSIARSSDAAT